MDRDNILYVFILLIIAVEIYVKIKSKLIKVISEALIVTIVTGMILPSNFSVYDIFSTEITETKEEGLYIIAGVESTISESSMKKDWKIGEKNEELEEQLITVESSESDTSLKGDEKKQEVLFSNAFESHTPNDVASQVYFGEWDIEKHKDLRGEAYKDTGGLYLSISNIFNTMGSGLLNPIISEIHLVLNPDYEGDKFLSGSIVVESEAAGSDASAKIIILVDGEEEQNLSTITGDTVEPIDFKIDLSNARYEVVIKIECEPSGNGLKLGIVNMSNEHQEY